MNKEKVTIIKELFAQGLTSTMIANELGINPKNLNYYIKTYNIEVLNKFRKYHSNDNFFDIIDSENKAYLLGFFIADGYLSENRRICLNNSIDDINILELFQKEVSLDSKIILSNKQKGAKFRKPQATIRISSNHMYNTLNKYGITENKTQSSNFSFDFNTIPKEVVHHFIRGYFDGDGSVSFYKTNRTIFFNFSFVFNSLNFTNQISQIFEDKFSIQSVIRKHIGKTSNWFSMRFNYNRDRTNKIKEIYNWLYKDSTIYLERKRLKFNNYLEYRANSIGNTIEQCNA